MAAVIVSDRWKRSVASTDPSRGGTTMMPRGPRGLSRREFLRRAGGAALTVPSLAAILAACEKPGALPAGTQLVPLARPGTQTTLPTYEDPIPTDAPIESGATLQIYNWDDYMYKKVLKAFAEEYDVAYEWTSFNNMEEGIAKMATGQIQADIFFPTVDYLARLVEAKLLFPLNHELIPNMERNVWPQFLDPYYDAGWQYSVPYVLYTTGIAYRRDHIEDAEVAEKGYSMLWDPAYRGKTGFYDSYRDALGMALLRRGVTDVNTGDGKLITQAKDDLLELLEITDAGININNIYTRLAEDQIWVAQSWSGDIVATPFYLPKGVSSDVLGYWYPEDRVGAFFNDLIVIPSTSQNPRLAHAFLNFFLDEKWGFSNFVNWNGYQPPFTTIKPSKLIADGWVPSSLPDAVLTKSDYDTGLPMLELEPEADQLWLDAWDEVTVGG
jgi:spermidine/putrescine transport system substrate-binding protein